MLFFRPRGKMVIDSSESDTACGREIALKMDADRK